MEKTCQKGTRDEQYEQDRESQFENARREIARELPIGLEILMRRKNRSVFDHKIRKRRIENAENEHDGEQALQFAILRDRNLPRNDEMKGIAQKPGNQRPGHENGVVFEEFALF